jgi:hypothetical protein
MSEQASENDMREVAHDMPDETSADVSRAHMLRFVFDRGLVHFRDGEMTVDDRSVEETGKLDDTELRDLQRKIRLQAAGRDDQHPHLPEAS